MQQVISFFNLSAKRKFVLKKYLKESLVKLCETRWVERHDSVLQFKSSLTEIIEALTEVTNWEDLMSASKAKTLLLSIFNCEFIISIFSLSSILSVTYHGSKILQGKNQDILSASNIVQDIVTVLKKNRLNCDVEFKNIFIDSKSLMDNLNIKLPRLTINQKNRSNPSNIHNCEDYYRIAIFIPLLDSIIEDLQRRFYGPENEVIKTLTSIIPKNLKNVNSANMVKEIKKHYPYFYDINDVLLKTEIDLWIQKWTSFTLKDNILPGNVFEALDECFKIIYPTIKSLLYILATLPISIATAERSFSNLRRLKTWMRSRMGQNRLTGLALLNVHRDINVFVEKIIDRFANEKKEH